MDVLKEADTDENQGTLGFEEFCSFYKIMSTRRDLYLLMLTYSNLKDHLDPDDLSRFLSTEQKVRRPSHIKYQLMCPESPFSLSYTVKAAILKFYF